MIKANVTIPTKTSWAKYIEGAEGIAYKPHTAVHAPFATCRRHETARLVGSSRKMLEMSYETFRYAASSAGRQCKLPRGTTESCRGIFNLICSAHANPAREVLHGRRAGGAYSVEHSHTFATALCSCRRMTSSLLLARLCTEDTRCTLGGILPLIT